MLSVKNTAHKAGSVYVWACLCTHNGVYVNVSLVLCQLAQTTMALGFSDLANLRVVILSSYHLSKTAAKRRSGATFCDKKHL